MAQMSPDLAQKIENNPDQACNVIVRVNGDLDSSVRELQTRGFQIRRTLRLIKGIAATAPGSALQALAEEPWVTHIEEDQQVHTM